MPISSTFGNAVHSMESTPASASERSVALDRFLRGVERRALRIAQLSTRDPEDALELVQDAMLAFARSYADKHEAEWPPLFHRVLDSRILDFHRRSRVRRRWRVWFSRDDLEQGDPLASRTRMRRNSSAIWIF